LQAWRVNRSAKVAATSLTNTTKPDASRFAESGGNGKGERINL
jgi:hypothetical protein